MKLVDRQVVEGTDPPVYIGHRRFRDRGTGEQRVCRTWSAEFCAGGKPRYRSLKTTVKRMAIKAAHQISPHAPAVKAPPPLSLAELSTEYMDVLKAQGRAPRTIQKYEHAFKRLAVWANEHGVDEAMELTEVRSAFLKKLTDQDRLSEKSRYTEAVIVKQMYKWAHRNGRIGGNPLVNVRLTEPAPKEQPYFTPEQVATLIDRAQGEFRAVIAFLAYTGARFGEMAQLRWEDVRFDAGAGGVIVIRRGGSGDTTKSRRIRRIPIHPALLPFLRALPRRGPWVFMVPPCRRLPVCRPLRERGVLKALKDLCRVCEFPGANRFRLHSLRHSFASFLARSRVGYKHALELMGHRESEVLDLYVKLFDSDLEAAVAAIHLPAPAPKREDDRAA